MQDRARRREENEALVRAYCAAWSRGDLPAIVGFYHDEVVLHWFGRGPLAGDHRGKAAALAALGKLSQLANRTLVDVHDVLASDTHAVILARERFERHGRTVESRRVLLYHLRDGKLAEAWVYDEDQRTLDELLSASVDAGAGVELPNVGEVLARVLLRVPPAHQPLLIAIAERRAAERYRRWANESADLHRRQLLACADREEEIARRVEGLHPDAAAVQRDLIAANPDLEEINRTLFAGRPLRQQFTIQAQGERLGAATWRALARREDNAGARETLLTCANLEEESAVVLESILSSME